MSKDSHYIHGTAPDEQDRLARLNGLLNDGSLRELSLLPGDKVLDVGCGLGQLARGMARQVAPGGRVIGIDRSSEQLAEARRLAEGTRESSLVEFRTGDAMGKKGDATHRFSS